MKAKKPCYPVTVSHRRLLIAELRRDPQLAAEYLKAAASDPDQRVYRIARKTVARAQR
jgi:DNA-binding phage protein